MKTQGCCFAVNSCGAYKIARDTDSRCFDSRSAAAHVSPATATAYSNRPDPSLPLPAANGVDPTQPHFVFVPSKDHPDRKSQ